MEDCVFCRIVEGSLPCARVYEDQDFLAFLDIRPVHRGHLLLIPKTHRVRLTDLPEEILARELPLAARLARAVLAATGATDFNLLNTNGPASGQEVFHHHLHVIPRAPGDGLRLSIAPASYGPGEMEALAERIAEQVTG
ncbi:MAG TPA: HIT domain-containing protein [Myxococcota bacterium]|nr:HIT domain-containing protein [Myxococcota bacterium]HQK52411.1 HIT domain-containing protein [Myxococcota bacterium]